MKSAKSSGFTLTEVMVALLISCLVAIGIYQIIRGQVQSTSGQNEASQVLRSSQRARFKLSTDIAQAGFNPVRATTLPAFDSSSNDSTLIVQGDFNTSGNFEDPPPAGDAPEVIRYIYDAAGKRVTRNSEVFLIDVDEFTVSYLNASNTEASPATAESSIRKVRVRWAQSIGDKRETYELTTSLKNRN
ncbi:MAG TPA: prepilin-type N-terminal cleavage/methylation domain-containing protein [Bdellovibrionota bacterium]|nr:prepilin-type N-terminal cleavage/methylation domain-containing protein [Bdellovibrionota bacterium]